MQISHLRIRRLSDRLKVVSQAFFILLVGFMVFDAFTSRSVAVVAFNAPSALAARGFTGDVVAAGVLDGLPVSIQSGPRLDVSPNFYALRKCPFINRRPS